MRLDINYRKKTAKKKKKHANSWRLNNPLLNNKEVTEEIRRETKRFLETNDNENTTQSLWNTEKSSSKKEVYSNTILSQETRKTSNRQPNFTPKQLEKEEQKKISGRKEIIKI